MSLLAANNMLLAARDPTLIAHWPLNDSSLIWTDTGTEVKDVSGNGYHGAAYGDMDVTNQVSGIVGDAALEVAASPLGTIDFGSAPFLHGLTAITISFYRKDPGFLGGSFLRQFSAADASRTMLLGNDTTAAGVLSFSVGDGAGLRAGTNTDSTTVGYPGDNIPMMETVTWEAGSAVRIFHDGVEDTGLTQFYTDNVLALNSAGTEHLMLSAKWDGGVPGVGYSGVIDDVRIYNRALSAQDVLALYNETKPI